MDNINKILNAVKELKDVGVITIESAVNTCRYYTSESKFKRSKNTLIIDIDNHNGTETTKYYHLNQIINVKSEELF